MNNKLLLDVYNIEHAKKILKNQLGSILLSIKDLSLQKYCNIDFNEIRVLSKYMSNTSNIIINLDKFYHPSDILLVKEFLLLMKELNLKYIMTLDLAIITLAKELDVELIIINGNSTLNTNYYTMNIANDFFDGHFISNEINYSEIIKIMLGNSGLKLIQVYGKQKIFYSKRHLLSSYFEYNKMPLIDFSCNNHLIMADIKDENIKSYICEDEHGTYLYTTKDVCALDYCKDIAAHQQNYLYLSNLFTSEKSYMNVVEIYLEYLNNDISLETSFAQLDDLAISYTNSFLDDETIFTIEEAKALAKEHNDV